jgi:hypothetical protein
MSISPVTILGFGVSGQLLVCQLLECIKGSQITIIDSNFCGGDLLCNYSGIKSNTTIGEKVEHLTQEDSIDDWKEIGLWLSKRGKSGECLPLSEIAADIQRKGHERAKECTCIYDTVTDLKWNAETKIWSVYFSSYRLPLQTQVLCICTGMEPRQEDYGVPSIPLSIALDPLQLRRIVLPGQKVVVFGLSHTGTLVLKHLTSINDVQVTGIYKGDIPFKYDRNGYYGGIKQESAEIADSILNGKFSDHLTLLSIRDSTKLSQKIHSANWIIQCIGFQPKRLLINSVNAMWNAQTGECQGFPQILSFGASNPATTEYMSKHYQDVSINSFLDQITARLPLLKQQMKDVSIIINESVPLEIIQNNDSEQVNLTTQIS